MIPISDESGIRHISSTTAATFNRGDDLEMVYRKLYEKTQPSIKQRTEVWFLQRETESPNRLPQKRISAHSITNHYPGAPR